MERLSFSQIQEFVNPQAFAVSRPASSEEANQTSIEKAIRPKGLNGSLGLLLGARKRMEDLYYNITTMRELAEQGAKGSLSDWKYDEIFGKLRSLTAGYEQALDGSKYDGKAMFDGRDIILDPGTGKTKLELENISASEEEGLNLVQRYEGARAFVKYDPGTLIRNQYAGVTGLDIKEAVGIPPKEGMTELEDGKYQLEIKYAGPESSLILRDKYGAKLEEKTNVDLTGNGLEFVQLDSGIQFKIEKIQLLDNFDKWDWEQDGPASLYADIDYEQVLFHQLDDGRAPPSLAASADWDYKPPRQYEGPALNFRTLQTNGIEEGKNGLKEGNYGLKVTWRGADSLVELRDENGRMLLRKSGVDLSTTGTHSIDLGLGVRFELENKDWTETGKVTHAQFSYKPEDEYTRDFDFKGFIEKLDAAAQRIDEQDILMGDFENQLRQIYSWQSGQGGGGTNSVASMLLGSVAGSGLTALIGGQSQAQSQFALTANQIFANLQGASSTIGGANTVLSYA